MPAKPLPDWERILSAAARLQTILPEAVLVGGTATAAHVHHRISYDADHTVIDLRERFDAILEELESVAGWETARIRRPVLILGSLDGIETGIRQLIRSAPLQTQRLSIGNGQDIVVPTQAEMLRIKAILILRRNATRDYLDFAALSKALEDGKTYEALASFDALYPQENGASARQQLLVQLANPMPYDLDDTDLSEYRQLVPEWQDWNRVKDFCAELATKLLRQS